MAITAHHGPGASDQSHERWPSPVYPALIGNVIPEFLSFSRNPFPALRETYEYLTAFARPLFESGKIRLRHGVTDVAKIPVEEAGGWKVVMTD